MKHLFSATLAVLSCVCLNAQIQGPNSGSSFSTSPITGSNQTWANPSNLASSNDQYATFGNITSGLNGYTDYLVATGFGFSIPYGVSISGIVVEIERADPNFRTADHSIRIVKGGVIGNTERAVSSGYPSTDAYQSFGNAGDLWGESWTDSDINDPGFGVAIAAKRSVSGGTTAGRIDHVRIIVFYDFITLPVKLSRFIASRKQETVELKWTTTDESDMHYYAVERSENARDYEQIMVVNSLNRSVETNYAAFDPSPLRGTTHYRLKTVEKNGTVKYSKVISVTFYPGNKEFVFPSVLKNNSQLFINNPGNEQRAVHFYHSSGQLIGKAATRSNQISTANLSLPKGNIVYKIADANGKLMGTGRLLAE